MSSSRGFSLVELLVVVLLLVPVFGLIVESSGRAAKSLVADEVAAKAMEGLQRTAVRVSQIARSCSLGTYRMQATQADVAAGRATAIGEWIEPVYGELRPGIRFQSATGLLSMNANALTPPQSIYFQRDSKEIANGIDDDADGLIDEGQIVLESDGIKAVLARNIEGCTFALDQRILSIQLRAGVRQPGAVVQRFTIRETLYLRNN